MDRITRRRENPSAPLIPQGALACKDFGEFIGLVLVLPVFEIDGRQDDDYYWVWDATLPAEPYWESSAGYRIYSLGIEYEPETLVLVSPAGQRCGFYVGNELWIDPEHRGQGLGAELVLAMTELLGHSPCEDQEAVGFSPAGYAAHLKAWRLAHERAAAALEHAPGQPEPSIA